MSEQDTEEAEGVEQDFENPAHKDENVNEGIDNGIKWKYLNDEKKYKIYEDGRVFSLYTNRFLTLLTKKTNKHIIIGLRINSKLKNFVVNSLIYTSFKNIIPYGYYVKNIDGNYVNNHINNLELVKFNEAKNKIIYDKTLWKDIENYEGRYVINKKGQVMSLITEKLLVDNHRIKFEQAYKSLGLVDKTGNRKYLLIHRLVFSTFSKISIKDFGNKVIDHIDRNCFNNNFENLRLISQSDNNKNKNYKIKVVNKNEKILSKIFKDIGLWKKFDFTNYEINKYGQVRNKNTLLLLSQSTSRNYKYIALTSKGKTYATSIHQLVATVFISNPNNYPIVHHKDENRSNNHISNLEWTTNKQNMIYSQGKKVNQYDLNGKYIKTFNCINDIYLFFNKTRCSSITNVCEGKRITAYGFKWKWYKEETIIPT